MMSPTRNYANVFVSNFAKHWCQQSGKDVLVVFVLAKLSGHIFWPLHLDQH